MAIANERHQIKSFPTPLSEDLVFYEIFDSTLPRNASFQFGATYASLHDQSDLFPNHVLVHVDSLPGSEKNLQRWFFAAPRSNQDSYNWSSSQADIGGTKFDSVVRSYVTLRSEYDPISPAQGSLMPDEPYGLFAGDYLLSGRKELPLEDELKHVFVAEQLEWVKRTTISSVNHDDMLGVGQGRTVNLYFRGEAPPGSASNIESLILNPGNAYWNVQSDGAIRTGEQLTAAWFAVTTFSSLDTALGAYKLSFPSSVDLDIPDELVSVTTVWNSAGSNGAFASDAQGRSAYIGDPDVSLSLSESAHAECGGSIQPEIIPNIRTRKGRDVPSTAWFFFVKSTADTLSASDLLTKLSTLVGSPVFQWPLFQPVQHTFILQGQRGSGRAQVSASGSVNTRYSAGQQQNNKEVSSAKGASYDASTGFSTVVLPPTIHGAITVIGDVTQTPSYTATCEVGWNSSYTPATVADFSIALPVPSNSGPGNLDPTSGGAGTVSDTATVNLEGSVTPASLSATTPPAIPTSGKYMVGSPRIEPYKARWFRVHAQVIDASIFVP